MCNSRDCKRDDQEQANGRPPVYMKTIGTFEVHVRQRLAAWKAGGTGARQLKRAVAYLVARRDHPVLKEVLIEVAGGREVEQKRHIVPNVVRMMKGWGLDMALKVQELTLTLRRHETWRTDTDQLEALEIAGVERYGAGDHEGAFRLLEEAAELCEGEYLPILDTVPEYTPHGENAYWKTVQKRALVTLLTVGLLMVDTTYHDAALRRTDQLIRLDRYDPRSYRLVAAVVRRCHNEEAARDFERRAAALEQGENDAP